ncbi:MAG TPA: hypothetical protein VFU21_29475, partial [Kofleriaceae bacterium]|nr:hypothetical protein [Kofleriaceae bacterium]
MKRNAVLLAVAAGLVLGGHPADAARATRPAKKMARFLGQKKLFRKQSASRSDFEARFASALEAPSDLMRSYAGVFWRMASKTPPARRLAKVGRVFGDAHRENFGFVRVGDRTVYGMTDYDDSGAG